MPELAEAQALGLTRLIGVSNFTIADLDEAEQDPRPRPHRHQPVRAAPAAAETDTLVDDCLRHGIAVTCYLPLARGACAGVPVIEAIARATRHPASGRACLSLNEGHIVIPTSGHADRIRQNFAARNIAA